MSEITTYDLVTGEVAGQGVFEQLMKSIDVHLKREFDDGRIKGGEYSQVYLGAMQTAMTQAIQFLLSKEKAGLEADLLGQQITNAITENTVLVAQECKLRAEYDLLAEQKLKVIAEAALLGQKKITEAAQVSAANVESDSVIGKQKSLYQAQTDGFARDAEQKAAKLLIDTFNVRRTTDEATVADSTNNLSDADIGLAVSKLMEGIGVTT